MTNQGSTPAGWYPAPGDPPGTHRYWDGSQWTTGPQPIAAAAPQPSPQPQPAPQPQAYQPPPSFQQPQAGYAYQAPAGGGGNYHGRTLADPGKRILARLIDGAVFLGAWIVVLILLSISSALGVLGYLAFLAVAVLYEPYFTATQGRTPGKKAMGLAVIMQDSGQEIRGWGPAFLRWVAGIIPCSYIISLILIFSDKNKESLHDKIGKTWVVNA